MKATCVVGTLALAASLYAASPVAGSADRTAWYRDAKFGMFIHWGP